MHMAVLGGRVRGGACIPVSRSTQRRSTGRGYGPRPVDIPTFDKAGPVKTGPVQLYGLPTG